MMKESSGMAACSKQTQEDWSWRKTSEDTSEETKVKFIDYLIFLNTLQGIYSFVGKFGADLVMNS